MKKFLLLAMSTVVLVGMSAAQNYAAGATGIMGVDKLGAHSNGGRGCTGCHAPHSGGAGGGGNTIVGQAANDPNSGNDALFGQDLTPLYGKTLLFGDNGMYSETLPIATAFAVADEEIRGIMMCLACHDGQVARGGMMSGKSYEQANSLLPVGVYGGKDIPTLLGADGSTAGNYKNDHPVGKNATLGAIGVAANFTYTVGGCTVHGAAADCLKVATAATKYANFVAHYGAPSIISNGHGSPVVFTAAKSAASAYVVCTTCHTPHSMYIVSDNADAPIAGNVVPSDPKLFASNTYPSYFFIAAPYNPKPNGLLPTQASSATQFCRQCHFSGAGGANEASGIDTVTTAF